MKKLLNNIADMSIDVYLKINKEKKSVNICL